MMKRALGFYEGYCHLLDRDFRGTAIVINVARFSGPINESHCIEVLKALQLRHPLLRSRVVEHEGQNDIFSTDYFDSLDDEARTQALPFTRFTQDDVPKWEDFVLTLSDESLGYYHWRVVLLKGSDTHELILLSAHAICDALSTTTLLKDIILGCGQLAEGSSLNWAPLPMLPCVEDQVPRPVATEAQAAIAPDRDHWPYQEFVDLEHRQSIMVFRQIPLELGLRLIQACKREGVTVNSALAASLLLSQYELLSTRSQKKKYLFSSAINLRSACTPVIEDVHFGSYVCCVNTYHNLDLDMPFWNLARAYGRELQEGIRVAAQTGYLPKAYEKNTVRQEIGKELERGRDAGVFPECPIISNLGRLKFGKNHGPFELQDIYFGTRQMAADCGMVLSAVTFEGKMSLCFSVPEPIMSRATAATLAATFIARIEAAC